jgi:hypothetical protein
MKSWRVTWGIDIEADTPREAAEKALAIQRDPFSCAVVFQVHRENLTGFDVTVDLEEAERDDN